MSTKQLPRKLSAILYADVAGYSRLTGEDEEGTHRQLSASLDLLSRTVASYGGRVVHYAGDAVLAEFDTATAALACAVAAQDALRVSNNGLPKAHRVEFRIGVNLGEVIVDREDIYGDGVNVAARLESLAEPGGVCTSESVRALVGNKLPFDYSDLGEQQVKNISRPIRAYRACLRPGAALPEPSAPAAAAVRKGRRRRPLWIALGAAAAVAAIGVALMWTKPWQPREEPASLQRMAFPLPAGPSIAVLPFDNMSGDPAQEYFSDGLTENLITSLSQVPDTFVIARNSTFTYKGTAVKVQQVAEELGVRYVVEGSYQRAGDQIRVHAQLIDALSGRHLWAEHFDRQWAELFALQDDLTRNIVGALRIRLTAEEKRRVAARYTRSVEAYDHFLRGQEAEFRFTPEDNLRARGLYQRAVDLDPDFARAYGALAMTFAYEFRFDWGVNPAASLERALVHARDAVDRDANLPQAHFVLGQVLVFGRHFADAIETVRTALTLDPNYADAYALLAVCKISTGDAAAGIAEIDRAMRLNPLPPAVYHQLRGRALYFAGRYQEAVKALQRAVEMNPNYLLSHVLLTAAYGQLDTPDDIEWQRAQLLLLQPDFVVEKWIAREIIVDAGYLELLAEGLRKAGLPAR